MGTGEPGPRIAPWIASAFCTGCIATVPIGFTLPAPVYLFLGALGIVALLAARLERPERWESVTLWPLTAILGAIAASAIAGPDPGTSVARYATMPLFALLFPAVQVAAWRPWALRIVFFAGAGALVAMSADSLLNAVQPLRGIARRSAGSLGNANDTTAAALLVPLAAAAIRPASESLVARAAASAVAVVAIARSGSRQAVLALLAVVAQPSVRTLSWKRALFTLGLVAGLAFSAIAASPRLRTKLLDTFETGLGYRETLVAFGITHLHEAPLLGHGPGLFERSHVAGVRDGWKWRGQSLRPIGMPWVHCLPLEIAFELGAVGVAAFGAVAFATVKRLATPRGRAPTCAAAAAAAMLTGVALVGLIDLSLLKDWVRCLVWLALGLAFVPSQALAEDAESGGLPVAPST